MKKNMEKSMWLWGMLSLFLVVGCTPAPVEFHDDLDLNICILCHENSLLNTPYVVGTEIRFTVFRNENGPGLDGAVLASSDGSILSISGVESGSDTVSATGKALSPGTVELVLFEDQEMNGTISTAEVEVAQPDAAHFYFAGPIIIHRDSLQNPVEESVQIVAGGTAAFLVEYTKDGQRLYGNGVLVPKPSSESVLVEVDHVYFFENNDWLIVTPLEEGLHTVDIEVGGEIIDTLTLEVVNEEAIQSVSVFEEKAPKGDQDGEQLFVWAVGQDANGEWIYGVDFQWALDNVVDELCEESPEYKNAVKDAIEEAIEIAEAEGISWEEAYEGIKPDKEDYPFEPCAGDLFSYTYDGDAPGTTLEASHGEKSDSTVIHYDPEGSMEVLNTEQAFGCDSSAGGGTPLRAGIWALLVLLGIGTLRRGHLRGDEV